MHRCIKIFRKIKSFISQLFHIPFKKVHRLVFRIFLILSSVFFRHKFCYLRQIIFFLILQIRSNHVIADRPGIIFPDGRLLRYPFCPFLINRRKIINIPIIFIHIFGLFSKEGQSLHQCFLCRFIRPDKDQTTYWDEQ